MKTIRILLATDGEASQTIRAAVQELPDIEVVAEETEAVRMLIAVAETSPDMVVISELNGGKEAAIVGHLLIENPFLVVLEVGSGACTYRFQIERTSVNVSRSEDLVRVIRNSCTDKRF